MDNDGRLSGDAAQRVARQSYGKLVAFLVARTGDVAEAEDALSEAFTAALSDWPAKGVPANPEAWLFTVARRRMIDSVRSRDRRRGIIEHIGLLAEERGADDGDADIPDDRLRLMFACAHPAIDPKMRSPLILQTILGLDAAQIAGAFLLSPGAMAQRLVRAKTKIRDAGIAFRLPDRADMPGRLDAVLAAIYAAFSEGWSDAAGSDVRKRELAREAIWLARLTASLLPDEPEALGLLALMLHLEARHAARRDGEGHYIPLTEQDTSLWNTAMIVEAEDILQAASHKGRIGRYQIEAAVQSAHAVRRFGGTSDWATLATLYDGLLALTGSPIVAINRATVIASSKSAREGLSELDRLGADAALLRYQPYWAARAELLARSGETAAAVDAYALAIELEPDRDVRRFLEQRRNELGIDGRSR